jgi:hypothetical protein
MKYSIQIRVDSAKVCDSRLSAGTDLYQTFQHLFFKPRGAILARQVMVVSSKTRIQSMD